MSARDHAPTTNARTEVEPLAPVADMIERVARAICRKDCMRRDLRCPDCGDDWQAFEGDAVAAIEAMREPTEAMVEAGLPENSCALPDGRRITMAVEPAYCAMIDAALAVARESASPPSSERANSRDHD